MSYCYDRFSRACPRTVRTPLDVYGSPLINALYFSCSCIFALQLGHTARVFRFLFSIILFHSYSFDRVLSVRTWCITVGLSTPQSSQRLVLSLSTNVGGGTITVNGCVSQFVFAFVVWRLNPSSYSIRYCCRPLSSLYGIINCLFVSYFFFNLLIVLLSY